MVNPTRTARLAIVLAAVLLAGGCAGRQRAATVWPPAPEKARIEHVMTFTNRDDLRPGLGRRLLNALVPRPPGAFIASPAGLALSPDERTLYVACGRKGRVVAVDRQSKTMKVVVGNRNPAARFAAGVALDAGGNIYVADRVGNSVFVYDAGGAFLRTFGKDILNEPRSIAIDRRGQLVYVLSGATSKRFDHRVEVFSLAGKHLRTIGKRGEGPGEFNFPSGLTVNSDGNLWVADMLNFRVEIFDQSGQLVSMFGQAGNGIVGAFDKIRGIAFDSFGNVYIADAMQGVQILSPDLRPLLGFGENPFMMVPGSIIIDSTNHIFVGDSPRNAVHEFKLVNTTAADSRSSPEQKPSDATSHDAAASPEAPASKPAAAPASPEAPAAPTPSAEP